MSDLKLDESSLDEAFELLPQIANSLKSLSVGISDIDLSGIGIETDFGKTVSLINDAISSNYSDSSIEVLRQNINDTRASLRRMNSNIGTLFEEIDDYPLDEFGNFSNFIEEKLYDNYVNVKLEEYLLAEFGNCVKLEKGGYKVDGHNGVIYYFPDDYVNSEVNLISYYPGDGGLKSNISLINMLETNGVSSGEVYALRTGCGVDGYHNSMGQGLYDYFDKTVESLNVKVKGFQTISFSGSGIASITEMNDYLKKHPYIENCSVILADAATVSKDFLVTKEYDMLVEKNVPVYLVCSKSSSYNQNKACEDHSSAGLNMYLLYENTVHDYSKKPQNVENWNAHDGINEVIFIDNLYRYFLDKNADIQNVSNYEVYKYVSDNNSVKPIKIEDFFSDSDIEIGSLADENEVEEEIVIDGQKVTVSTKYETLDDGTKYQVNIIGEIN